MKILKLFIALCTVEFFLYLLGSFASASFSIDTWDPGGRTLVGLFGFICAIPIAGLVIAELES